MEHLIVSLNSHSMILHVQGAKRRSFAGQANQRMAGLIV